MDDMSKAYGTALFALACENNAKDEYCEALNLVATVVKENPEYLELLAIPGITMAERLGALDEAFAASVPEHVLSFLKLLCEKGHIRSFCDCVEQYKKLLEASKRVLRARVVSAVELTEEEEKRLQAKLEKISGNTVILDKEVDAALLGGMIVEMDGKVMDGSLRSRLHEVKEVMSR